MKKAHYVTGEVVKKSSEKTISVLVFRNVKHKKYGKYLKRKTYFKVHDEKNQAEIGDKVVIQASRPMSKTKRWSLVQKKEFKQ